MNSKARPASEIADMKTGPDGPVFLFEGYSSQWLSSGLAAADRCADAIEAKAHIVAETTQGGDQHNCDQCGDQTIFNGCCARLALPKLLQKLFQRTFPSDMRTWDGAFYSRYLSPQWPHLKQNNKNQVKLIAWNLSVIVLLKLCTKMGQIILDYHRYLTANKTH